MRIAILSSFAAATLGSSPVYAQDGGSAPPPSGPPTELPTGNRGMGAITDIPMQTTDPRTAGENAIARKNGRNAGTGKRSSEAELALAYGEALDAYVGKSGPRRLEALGAAKAAKAGTLPAQSAEEIRAALEADLADWRDTFGFDKATWQDQRDQWLTARDATTAADWAKRRADWYKARDAWIAEQMAWAAKKAVSN